MEHNEFELVKSLKSNNHELDKLYREHVEIEEALDTYSARNFLTAAEEQTTKGLKKKKLEGVDRMMKIVSCHSH